MNTQETPTKDDITSNGSLSGSGHFSRVFIMPDGKAARITERVNTDGWLFWAVYCMMKEAEGDFSENLPRIDGLRIDWETNIATSVMEALVDICGYPCEEDAERDYYYDLLDDLVYEFKTDLEKTFQVCMYLDFSVGHNWMWRGEVGKTGVITDPFTISGWRDLNSNDKYYLEKLYAFCQEEEPSGLNIEWVNVPVGVVLKYRK